MTDNSFPTLYTKREGQIYFNTWHGTPLKYLGRSDIKNAVSLGNIQKNYFACDYALFPNDHTKDVFMKDYMLERMYKGYNLMADYPRNAALLNTEGEIKLKEKLGLTDKKLTLEVDIVNNMTNEPKKDTLEYDILHYFDNPKDKYINELLQEEEKRKEFIRLFRLCFDDIIHIIQTDPKQQIAVNCLGCRYSGRLDLSACYGKHKK